MSAYALFRRQRATSNGSLRTRRKQRIDVRRRYRDQFSASRLLIELSCQQPETITRMVRLREPPNLGSALLRPPRHML
jgi:hypothetical protein